MSPWLRPKVTVIIPTSSNATALLYALQSAKAQTYRNLEVWVIGQGVDPAREQVISEIADPRIFAFDCPDATSVGELLYAGLRRARGEFVAYLDEKDVWLPGHLQVLLETIEEEEADIVLSITQHVHSASYSTLNIPLVPDFPLTPDLSSILHRRSVMQHIRSPWQDRCFVNGLFELVSRERLRIRVSGVTTGLKFLSLVGGDEGDLRRLYVERLNRDPDFVNKELSSILLRRELDSQRFVAGRGWGQWVNRSWSSLLHMLWQNKDIARKPGQLRMRSMTGNVHQKI